MDIRIKALNHVVNIVFLHNDVYKKISISSHPDNPFTRITDFQEDFSSYGELYVCYSTSEKLHKVLSEFDYKLDDTHFLMECLQTNFGIHPKDTWWDKLIRWLYNSFHFEKDIVKFLEN